MDFRLEAIQAKLFASKSERFNIVTLLPDFNYFRGYLLHFAQSHWLKAYSTVFEQLVTSGLTREISIGFHAERIQELFGITNLPSSQSRPTTCLFSAKILHCHGNSLVFMLPYLIQNNNLHYDSDHLTKRKSMSQNKWKINRKTIFC